MTSASRHSTLSDGKSTPGPGTFPLRRTSPEGSSPVPPAASPSPSPGTGSGWSGTAWRSSSGRRTGRSRRSAGTWGESPSATALAGAECPRPSGKSVTVPSRKVTAWNPSPRVATALAGPCRKTDIIQASGPSGSIPVRYLSRLSRIRTGFTSAFSPREGRSFTARMCRRLFPAETSPSSPASRRSAPNSPGRTRKGQPGR